MQKLLLTCCFVITLGLPARAQDPDLEADERDALERVFRTGDLEGELPTDPRDRQTATNKRMAAPADAQRIGCLCMDDTPSAAHSAGACSGRGGVRFWLYRTKDGDTLRILTGRHERHPQALDSAERSAMNPPPSVRPPRPGSLPSGPGPWLQPLIITAPAAPLPMSPGDHDWFDWSDAATVSGGGFTLFLTLRLLLRWIDSHQPLVRYALRYLLRFGKRPVTRPRRQAAAKKRL